MATNKAVSECLDDMALKIMMIEPGDLSMVGDLLELVEQIINGPDDMPVAKKMAEDFKKVLEMSIMGELSDSKDTYEKIADCITQMQETCRKEGQPGPEIIKRFCDNLSHIGFQTDVNNYMEGEAGGTEAGGGVILEQDREQLSSFIGEAFEHLEAIEENILELEKNQKDPEIINNIFRPFHTIKGVSDLLKLTTINKLSHGTESLLDKVRNGEVGMDEEITNIILEVKDMLRAMVGNVRDVLDKGPEHYRDFDINPLLERVNLLAEAKKPAAGGPEEGPAQAVEQPAEAEAEAEVPDFLKDKDLLSGFIAESIEHLESIEVNILDLEQNPDDMEIINNIFRPFHTIKGVSGFLNLKNINKIAHTTENLLDDVRNDRIKMNPEIIDVVLSVGDFIRSMIQNIKDVLDQGPGVYQEFDISEYVARIKAIQGQDDGGGPEPAVKPAAAPPAAEAQASAPPQSQPSPTAPPAVPGTPAAATKVHPAVPKPPAAAKQGGATRKTKVGDSIKVDIEKLDGLVNAVGELVIMQSLVQQNSLVHQINDPKLTKDLSQLSRITSDLQKTAMSMRMVPIRQTFQKMIRLVRDLSKKTGKKVDLIMSGEETEIDRNMVDSIYDPLVHMIRNSVDHGVQPPEERKNVGKPETGTVNLRAYQKGGNMVIEIEDDGNGLNTAKIREKALQRGLIMEGDTSSDYEINNLIFLPGFSTADKVTDVSGRGVGMDVVKKAVEKMRGKVEVDSQPGDGSLFTIRLPLTLAIIDGIIVRVGTERYIIPTTAIQESMRPAREKYNTVHEKGETLMIRNKLVPIIRLYKIFEIADPSYTDPCDAIVVVVENEGRTRALMVDELLGKQEVVIKNLGGYLKDIQGVAGGTILGDGRVGLILDLAGVFASSEDIAN